MMLCLRTQQISPTEPQVHTIIFETVDALPGKCHVPTDLTWQFTIGSVCQPLRDQLAMLGSVECWVEVTVSKNLFSNVCCIANWLKVLKGENLNFHHPCCVTTSLKISNCFEPLLLEFSKCSKLVRKKSWPSFRCIFYTSLQNDFLLSEF